MTSPAAPPPPPRIIEERPAVIFEVIGRLDMEEMGRLLNPSQISAVMGGIAQVIAASKRDLR